MSSGKRIADNATWLAEMGFNPQMPGCMAPDGAQPCAAYTTLLIEVAELRKLCALVAAFSAPRLREHRLWILADAVDQAKALLSSESNR